MKDFKKADRQQFDSKHFKPEIKKIRAESFGAIVSIKNPPALVYVDRSLAASLGVKSDAWRNLPDDLNVQKLSAPTEVHLSTTDRCPAGCQTCYMDAKPDGYEPPINHLKERLQTLGEIGVFNVAFGGGESTLRKDLFEIAAYASQLGITVSVTTSGQGINQSNAKKFNVFAQVNVSYDGSGDVYEKVRGYQGASAAEKSMTWLMNEGIQVGANVVVTQQNFEALEKTFERLDVLQVKEVQLLRLKPAGRAKMDYLSQRLTQTQIKALPKLIEHAVKHFSFSIRIDCSMVPFLTSGNYFSPESLVKFGVMGCEAGRSLMTLDSRGNSHPCSFWKDELKGEKNITAKDRWDSDSTLDAFRNYHAQLPEPCGSCAFKTACRGGCQVVSRFDEGSSFKPDPECPQVVAFNDSFSS